MRKTLKLSDPSLLTGRHLIEASAGTGKTYSLAVLICRVLLETPAQVHSVLAVTFTKAATEELKQRVRLLLGVFRSALTDPASCKDDMILGLCRGLDRDAALAKIRESLYSLDEAPIYTIHAFCQKLLTGWMFSGKVPVRYELGTDSSQILKRAATEELRKRAFEGNPVFWQYALKKNFSRETLLRIAKQGPMAYPLAEREWGGIRGDAIPGDGQLKRLLEGLSEDWSTLGPQIIEWYMPVHKSNAPIRLKLAGELLGGMMPAEERLGLWMNDQKNLEKLEHLTWDKLSAKHQPPEELHGFVDRLTDFFAEWEDFQNSALSVLGRWGREWLDGLDRRLERYREESGTLGFDDLIRLTYDFIVGNPQMREQVARQYRSVFIDEFQDTDPMQYEIFSALFSNTPMVLIGDPKQSIYRFRGADVESYRKAESSGLVGEQDRHTMERNYRSDGRVVDALHVFFSGMGADGFGKDFPRVTSAKEDCRLTISGSPASGLVLWRVKSANSDKGMPLNDYRTKAATACADEVMRLFRSDTRVEGRPLKFSDIAVLTRSHAEAAMVQREFSKNHIPSVLYQTESVFQTEEARELGAVLDAAADFSSAGKIRGALLTPVCGFSMEELDAFRSNDALWARTASEFREHHALWQKEGVLALVTRLFSRYGTRERLAVSTGGDRKLTNFLHLAELLSRLVPDPRSPEAVLEFLAGKLEEGEASDEEWTLRVETEEESVRILTIHKSKGLEFGIVFAPFIYSSKKSGGEQPAIDLALWHGKGGQTLSLRPNGLSDEIWDQALLAESRENAEEDVRKLYVALTRAVYRVYTALGEIAEYSDSVMARAVPPEGMDEKLSSFCAESEGAIEVVPLPESLPGVLEPERTPPGLLKTEPAALQRQKRDFDFTSFTRLTGHETQESPFRTDEKPPQPEEETKLPEFPRGPRAGSALHRMLEKLDFQRPSELREVIDDALREFFPESGASHAEWAASAERMLRNLLKARLPLSSGHFRLEEVPLTDRLTEVGFLSPIGRVPQERWEDWMKKRNWNIPYPEPGYMKGFIDSAVRRGNEIILIDWKSNDLGSKGGGYSPLGMLSEMELHRYELQALIYMDAFGRYLSIHGNQSFRFGGVLYVFLRGVTPDGSEGVHFVEYRPALLAEFRELWGGGHV